MITPDNPLWDSSQTPQDDDLSSNAHPIDAHFRQQLVGAEQVPPLSWETMAVQIKTVQGASAHQQIVSGQLSYSVQWRRWYLGLSVAASVGIGIWLFWPNTDGYEDGKSFRISDTQTSKPMLSATPDTISLLVDSADHQPSALKPQTQSPVLLKPDLTTGMENSGQAEQLPAFTTTPPSPITSVATAPHDQQENSTHSSDQQSQERLVVPAESTQPASSSHPNSPSPSALLPTQPIVASEVPIMPKNHHSRRTKSDKASKKWLKTVAYSLQTLPGVETQLKQEEQRTIYQFRTALFKIKHTDYR
jgi:hypothetical protein